jgi:hypothetical protein
LPIPEFAPVIIAVLLDRSVRETLIVGRSLANNNVKMEALRSFKTSSQRKEVCRDNILEGVNK